DPRALVRLVWQGVGWRTRFAMHAWATSSTHMAQRNKRSRNMCQNRVRQRIPAIVFTSVCALTGMSATAKTPPDNTKVNQRDRAKGAVTADQQKENATDRDLTQKVRRALMQDKTLSTYAHNVKIITQNGSVTLKGPVRSEQERATVEAKATEVVGAGHVTNQMSVAPERTKK